MLACNSNNKIMAEVPKLRFSIENILKKTHNSNDCGLHSGDIPHQTSPNGLSSGELKERRDFTKYPVFDWLQCTRYKPPKVSSKTVFGV